MKNMNSLIPNHNQDNKQHMTENQWPWNYSDIARGRKTADHWGLYALQMRLVFPYIQEDPKLAPSSFQYAEKNADRLPLVLIHITSKWQGKRKHLP